MQESSTPAPAERFQILSLDGGGLKGLFSACFLAEWEQHVGRPITSSFDLIAGTSTGGIIALALGAGFPAAQIVEFYRQHGPAIFPAEVFEAVGRARQAFGSRYRPEPLESVLDEYFGARLLGGEHVGTTGGRAAPLARELIEQAQRRARPKVGLRPEFVFAQLLAAAGEQLERREHAIDGIAVARLVHATEL